MFSRVIPRISHLWLAVGIGEDITRLNPFRPGGGRLKWLPPAQIIGLSRIWSKKCYLWLGSFNYIVTDQKLQLYCNKSIRQVFKRGFHTVMIITLNLERLPKSTILTEYWKLYQKICKNFCIKSDPQECHLIIFKTRLFSHLWQLTNFHFL